MKRTLPILFATVLLCCGFTGCTPLGETAPTPTPTVEGFSLSGQQQEMVATQTEKFLTGLFNPDREKIVAVDDFVEQHQNSEGDEGVEAELTDMMVEAVPVLGMIDVSQFSPHDKGYIYASFFGLAEGAPKQSVTVTVDPGQVVETSVEGVVRVKQSGVTIKTGDTVFQTDKVLSGVDLLFKQKGAAWFVHVPSTPTQ